MTGNERAFGKALFRTLKQSLPKRWSTSTTWTTARGRAEGLFKIRTPKGAVSRFAVHVRTRFEPRDVPAVQKLSRERKEPLLLLAPYFSDRSRALLRQCGISYLDPTGNTWLAGDAVLIDRAGTEPAARGEDRVHRASLRGPVTGRVIRFLCDARPPLNVGAIATETRVHAGYVSRILTFLEREQFIERDGRGTVVDVDWPALLVRWSVDVQRDRASETFFEVSGIDVVLKRVAALRTRYAITGTFAHAAILGHRAPIALDVYVPNIDDARETLGLRPSARIGNVRLIEAFDDVVFDATWQTKNRLILAAPTQVAADLLTLSAHPIEDYDELTAWMQQHEDEWRDDQFSA